jgi:hypothetical protein
MKDSRASLLVFTLLFCQELQADPVPFLEGLELDRDESHLLPDGSGLLLGAGAGTITLRSGLTETDPWDATGGIHLEGTPIRLYLGASAESPQVTQGSFEIWPFSAATATTANPPAGEPLFVVNSAASTAKFKGLNVTIEAGTLKVGTSAVLTEASMPAYFQGITGTINIGNGQATRTGNIAIGLNSPVSDGYRSVAIGDGTSTGWYSFAAGESAQATNSWTIAMGYDCLASGSGSVAFGRGQATGENSFAVGQSGAAGIGSTAMSWGTSNGNYSVALGFGAIARSYGATTIGLHSQTPAGNATQWVATDPVFIVGNGTYWGTATSSNAQVTLKNGKTTLINKTWSATNALADPSVADTSDANGEALVVDGHTRLRGKVIIEKPQGDVSAGEYQ